MGAPRIDRLDRNYIINGNFDFWQRGISLTPTVNNTTYTSDRFSIAGGSNAGGAVSVTRVAGPGGVHQYAARVACTTAQALVNAGATLSFNHVIEGTFWRDIFSRTGNFVLKFKARSFQTGTFGLQLGNSGFTQIYQVPITFNASGVWQDFSFVVPIPTAGTWLTDTGAGLYVRLALVVGTNGESSTINTWSSTATIRGITGQNNFLSSTSNYIELAAYQLYYGDNTGNEFSTAGRDYTEELRLCQRYYEKTYELDNSPGFGTYTGAYFFIAANSASQEIGNLLFKTPKRGVPIINLYSPLLGTPGFIRDESAGANIAQGASSIGSNMFQLGTGAKVSGRLYTMHYTAEAEL